MKKLLLIIGIIALLVVGYLVFINPQEVTPSQEPSGPQTKIDLRVACESALAYTTFSSGEEAGAFVKDCIDGKYPEVIERYIQDMGLNKPVTENTPTNQIANPASVNCIEKGGKHSLVDGMCTLSDGTVCEEWAYFRGECPTK